MTWSFPETYLEKTARQLLRPATWLYEAVGNSRSWLYKAGTITQLKVPARVISVGNISCGGTGKTPVVIDFARQLLVAGQTVAILSRGYKRQSKSPVIVASDGNGHFATCENSGDEPYLIARSVPEAVVLVGASRKKTAAIAVSDYKCDTILLDDGFQHLPIARDLDVVLLDYNDPVWLDMVLPAGRLREPLTALARAKAIVITKVPKNPDLKIVAQFRAIVTKYAKDATLAFCQMQANRLLRLPETGYEQTLLEVDRDQIDGVKVLALSAIARPKAFVEQLGSLGANIVAENHFADHHWYTPEDLANIMAMARHRQAKCIVTTAKDAVKLPSSFASQFEVLILDQRLVWTGEHPLDSVLPEGQRCIAGAMV